MSAQQKPPRFPPREIHINDVAGTAKRNHDAKYTDNSVSTTKYTLISFLPKNLFEQFRRVANFYFLCIAVIQLAPGISPVSPITSFFPLVFVLAITAIKEALEDFRRYQADKNLNNTPTTVVENGVCVIKPWKDVAVGDILQLKSNDFLPADMVLLYADNPGGMAYIETSNLDGETNLKIKQALPTTQSGFTTPLACSQRKGVVYCQGPTLDLYNFEGKLADDRKQEFALGKDQMILRGCAIRNTPTAYGIVVYTGHETKLMQNAGAAPSKRTTLEKHLNRQILLMFLFQAVCCIFSAVASGLFASNIVSNSWYLSISNNYAVVGVLAYFTFLILYNIMIPISLYVSMEIVKLAQVLFLGQDLEMYYSENDTPAKARTSNLNEELGQVEYIFSDKTGTLTRNVMEFMKCTVGGISYGRGITEIEAANAAREGKHLEVSVAKTKGYNFEDPAFLHNLRSGHPTAQLIREFLICLSVNHAVIPEPDPKNPGQVVYQAASPDENALVLAAKYLGFEFVSRTPTTVTIRVDNQHEETYEILNLLEFTSKRKRSSVIVRTPRGELKLYCKGADNVIKERLDYSLTSRDILDKTMAHLEVFAGQGLRTLVLAAANLDPRFYEGWAEEFRRASMSIGGKREHEIEAVSEKIEQRLVLLGATAIEDKLQHGVPQAIEKLEEANIKVWMLTGDKQETAINIGYACNLIDNSFTQIKVNAEAEEVTREILSKKCNELRGVTMDSAKLALIIDGFTLGFVFDPEIDQSDAEAGRTTLTSMLMEIAEKCRAVICCRMSPKQKALVVQTVKKSRTPSPITLSIGDGANDVPMIQKAHIGVGISGEEGLQAVRAADFAIAQFRFLERLLLVHGRISYKRIAKLVLYSFYKNMTFALTLFWFAIFCGWSGQTLFDSWAISLFNVIFTGIPIVVLSIFDTDVSPDSALKHPKLYIHGQKGREFNQPIYWLWIARGVYHSVVCFFVPFLAWGIADIMPQGYSLSVFSFGLTVLYCVVFTVTLTIMYEQKSWNWINVIGLLSVYVLLFGFTLIYSLIYAVSADMYYVAEHIMTSGTFWMCIMLSSGICHLPPFVISYLSRNYAPEAYHIVQEVEHGLSNYNIEAPAVAMKPVARFDSAHHTGYSFDNPRGDFTDNTGGTYRPQVHSVTSAARIQRLQSLGTPPSQRPPSRPSTASVASPPPQTSSAVL